MADGNPGQQSQYGSAHAQLVEQSPPQRDHDDDDGDGKDDNLPLSVIQGNRGTEGKVHGGRDGGDSGNGGADWDYRGDADQINGTTEFALVISRNIDVKQFSGEIGVKHDLPRAQ